jgi:hypothetical protein
LPSQTISKLGNKAVGASLFFGFFLLAKQKKETRLVAKNIEQAALCM